MMLESSLGKILATKPVEPSITKEDAVAPTKRSEAEVRIVFRFFVEEQIVFDGKIEKVKQLESEEISRIVSRIAWDGAKEEKKPLLDNEIIKNDKIIDCHQQDAEKNDRNESTEDTKSAQGSSMSGGTDSIGQEGGSNEVVDMDCCLLESNESTSGEVTPERGPSISCNQGLSASDTLSLETPTSDNQTSASIPNPTCESDSQTKSSYQVVCVKKDKHLEEGHVLIDQEPVVDRASTDVQESELLAAAAEAAAEDQMIVDALNDCVHNVDLESRKNDQTLISDVERTTGSFAVEATDDGYIKMSLGQHNEQPDDTSRENVKSDKKPLAEAANVPSNNDTTQVTVSNSDDSFYKEKDAHTHQSCNEDLNPRLESNKKPDISLTSRRRNTCDNPTSNRRVRRGGSKDQRTPRVSAPSKLGEDAIERQASDRGGDMAHSGENLIRQTKVFAKWSDNHFYPGTILKSAKDRKFEIGFFDGARKDVAETDLFLASNIINRQVRVMLAKDYCVNALVHGKTISSSGQPLFDVEYQQKELVKKTVPLKDIFLTAEQGLPLINQPIRPDKNPDESMFAGVDLDNIVHVKRSRRLQEMEDLETAEEATTQLPNNLNGSRRKRGQYNMRNTTNRARASNIKPEESSERDLKRMHTDVNNQDTPVSSCSPDNLKPHLHSSNSNPPSESSSSTGSTNSAPNVHEMGQEFYFESSSPHRTKTSLLL